MNQSSELNIGMLSGDVKMSFTVNSDLAKLLLFFPVDVAYLLIAVGLILILGTVPFLYLQNKTKSAVQCFKAFLLTILYKLEVVKKIQ